MKKGFYRDKSCTKIIKYNPLKYMIRDNKNKYFCGKGKSKMERKNKELLHENYKPKLEKIEKNRKIIKLSNNKKYRKKIRYYEHIDENIKKHCLKLSKKYKRIISIYLFRIEEVILFKKLNYLLEKYTKYDLENYFNILKEKKFIENKLAGIEQPLELIINKKKNNLRSNSNVFPKEWLKPYRSPTLFSSNPISPNWTTHIWPLFTNTTIQFGNNVSITLYSDFLYIWNKLLSIDYYGESLILDYKLSSKNYLLNYCNKTKNKKAHEIIMMITKDV